MKEKMTISVAMTTYNGAQFLDEQLRSIENQTLLPDEIVICDDGSTDSTRGIIRNFSEKSRIPVVCQKNEETLGYARNFFRAISMTRGDVIFLSDQDDVWQPGKLAHMTGILERHPEILVLASSFTLIDRDGQTKRSLEDVARRGLYPISWKSFLRHPKYMGMLLAVRREVYEGVLQREEQINKSVWSVLPHDWRLCEYAAEHGGLYKTGEKLAFYRQHGKNTVGSVLNGGVDVRKRRCELVRNEVQEYVILEKTLRQLNQIKKQEVPTAKKCVLKDSKKNKTVEVAIQEKHLRFLQEMIAFSKCRYRFLTERQFIKLVIWNLRHLRFITMRASMGDLFALWRKSVE